jgi:hypothetical protein
MRNVIKRDINNNNNVPIKLSDLRLNNLLNRNMRFNIKRARQSVLKNDLKCLKMAK